MDTAAPITPAKGPGDLSPAEDLGRALVVLVLWVAYAIWQQWGHWGEDLAALYVAGHLWHTGQPDLIYAAPPGFFGGTAPEWAPVMADLGVGDKLAFPYIYPPLWAVLMAPVSAMIGPQGFGDAVTLIQMPMLAASVLMAALLLRTGRVSLRLWAMLGVAALLTSMQSFLILWHNQPTITTTFLILVAFTCLDRNRPVAAGAALALAAALKLTPAAFALIFLIDRQYRALAAFAVTGAALAMLSVLLAGADMHVAFIDSLRAVRGTALMNAMNVSLLPALMAAGSGLGLAAPLDPQSHLAVLDEVPGWLIAGISLAGLVLTAAFLHALRDRSPALRRGIGVFALSLILALFGPLGWLHYYMLPLFLLPGLFGLFDRRRATALALLVAVPSLRPVFLAIGGLPWGVPIYVSIACATWLAVLAALYLRARQRG
jgi:hypothetical protein